MYTQITPQLFALLVGNREGTNLHVAAALLIEGFAITEGEYDHIISGALAACHSGFAALSRGHRGVCTAFADTLRAAACDGEDMHATRPAKSIVRLRNDPTNACEYNRFRAFTEAFMLNEPRLVRNKDGSTSVTIGPGTAATRLFAPKGTGFALRSPNEVVQYLGDIVRETYRSGVTPRLTNSDGESVPIFVVETGPDAGRASVTARVDDAAYWIRRQELGGGEPDFSHRALGIAKDFQALNTSQSQLPKSPRIVIDGSGT